MAWTGGWMNKFENESRERTSVEEGDLGGEAGLRVTIHKNEF